MKKHMGVAMRSSFGPCAILIGLFATTACAPDAKGGNGESGGASSSSGDGPGSGSAAGGHGGGSPSVVSSSSSTSVSSTDVAVSSSATGMMACVPGAQMSCYDGPPATQGIGACHDGKATCKADGSAYGPCVGQVVPKAEDCSTAKVDDDCDGQAKCLGAAQWSRDYGSDGETMAFSNAQDSKGNIYVAGHFGGTVDFGGGPRVAMTPGVPALVLLKLDPTGAYVWDKVFDNGYSQEVNGVAVDENDNVYLTGYYAASLDFHDGCQVASVLISQDLFIAKLDSSGKCQWARGYGDDGFGEIGGAIAVAPNGDIGVAGRVDTGAFDLGNGVTVNSPVQYGSFIARFDPTGEPLWAKGLAGSDPNYSIPQYVNLAFDSHGNMAIGGYFLGSIALDAKTTLVSQGGMDTFVAELDPGGAVLWSHRAGDANPYQWGVQVVVDGVDHVVFAGYYQGELTFDKPLPMNDPWYQTFVVKMTPKGDYEWSRGYVGGEQQMYGVHTDAMNNIVFMGVTDGPMDVGNGVVLPGGPGYDAFAVKLDPNGDAYWAHDFAVVGMSPPAPLGMSSNAAGDTLITGFYQNSIDFGDKDSPHQAPQDAYHMFVVNLAP